MKKDKVNFEELNVAINTGSKILKLFYVFMIMALIGGVIVIFRALNILPILGTIISVISPFFIGFILAWLLNPIVNMLTDKGMKRSLASGLIFLMLFVVAYLFCLAIIPALITQINDMAKMIPDMLADANNIIDKIFIKLSNLTTIDMSSVKLEFLQYLEEFAKNFGTNLPTKVIGIVEGLVSGIGKLLIGLVIGFYLLFNFNSVKAHVINIIPKKVKKDAERLFGEISAVLFKFVNGTFMISLILLVISIVGFSIIGLKAPVLFAFFCAITNIIPYVGPYIGGIPAVLVGFSQSPLTGILTLVFVLAVQLLEGNFLHPIVIGKKMDLHPVTIVISLLIFEYFFGIIGMIVATPIVAIIKILYEFLDEKFDFFGYTKSPSVKKSISKINQNKDNK